MDWLRIEGNVVAVAGGAGRIGTAICTMLSSVGCRVICLDLADSLARLQTAPSAPDVEMLELNADSDDDVRRGISAIVKKHGRLDGMVVSIYPRTASYGTPMDSLATADFQENAAIHLGGYFALNRACGEVMALSGGGSVVNISSIYGVAVPRFEMYADTTMTMPVEYAVIKSGLNHMTRYFARWYRGRHVRFNALCPGGVEADQPTVFQDRYAGFTDAGRLMHSTEIADAVLFMLSPRSTRLNGQVIVLDDGFLL